MRAVLMIAILAIAVPDRPDPTPKEPPMPTPQEQILGDWAYIGNGPEPRTPPAGPNYVFRIMPSETIWLINGQPSAGNGFTAKVTFDWTKNPIPIDFKAQNGSTNLPGILRLQGDHLTLAWSNNGTGRPAAFAPPHNIHHFVRLKK